MDARPALEMIKERAVRRDGRLWPRRTSGPDEHSAAGLQKVTAAVLAAADVGPGDQVVDVGCGRGLLSLPLAERGAHVFAVDPNPDMVQRLAESARVLGLDELVTLAVPLEQLSVPDGSVDLVVTSYALHHLRDADKERLVTAAFGWLRPGGMLLVADMMFGRGGTKRDREIIRFKVRRLAGRGIGGWWRIAKNAWRYLIRMRERPASITAWTAMLGRAGFTGIAASPIVAEAGLVRGRRPS